MTCNEASILLDGLIDGQLTAAQSTALDAHLVGCPRCQRELDQLRRLEGVMKKMALPSLPDEMWDAHWGQLYNRLERGAGYVLAGLGAILLLSYGAYQLCREWLGQPGIPIVVRLGCGLVVLGLIVLTVSTVREKLLTHRYDPYKEIKR